MSRGGGTASSNWRYLTEADQQGPRKDEMMMSTTYAKAQFNLSTRDISCILGFRRPPAGGRYGGGTQTMYYEADLKKYAIRLFGQERYNRETKYGREDSGIAQQERDKAEREQAAAAQVSADQRTYAVVPADRLGNLSFDKLQAILVRCEGGKVAPWCVSKAGCVERILNAGYSMEKEAAEMAKQKEVDEAEAARRKAEYEAHLAAEAKRKVVAAEKARADAELKQKRARQFEAGELSVDDLKYQELMEQCRRVGVPAKEYTCKKKPEVLEILRAAIKRGAAAAGAEPGEGLSAKSKAEPAPETFATAGNGGVRSGDAFTSPMPDVPTGAKADSADNVVPKRAAPAASSGAAAAKKAKLAPRSAPKSAAVASKVTSKAAIQTTPATSSNAPKQGGLFNYFKKKEATSSAAKPSSSNS